MPFNIKSIAKIGHGFTLIELIGVLAILSIMAAIVAPNLIKKMQIDRQEAEEEILNSLADGLTNYIIENRIIPISGYGSSTWSNSIAAQVDLSQQDVHENFLTCSRRYWFDPSTDLDGLSDNSAAYDQNTTTNISGSSTTSPPSPPANPRAMIISDITPGCANSISSVAHNTANFANTWDQTTPPSGLTEGDTLKIKRVYLSALFETVTLRSSPDSIFVRKTYDRPPSLFTFVPGDRGPVTGTVTTIEKNSHIFSLTYSTGGFSPTNIPGGTATVKIGYSDGGNEFLQALTTQPVDVTNGTTSPSITNFTPPSTTSDIKVSLELTIESVAGDSIYAGNSGYIDITLQYQGEPQYQIEGQPGTSTISIAAPGTTEIRSFNVIDGTKIDLYDQSWTAAGPIGDHLLSAIIKEPTILTYSPGPPTYWGK